DTCARPLDLTGVLGGSVGEGDPVCCRPPTHGDVDGGLCAQDSDCCQVFAFGMPLVRCCTSPDQQGCRPGTFGRCAGCGPGTRVPCCQPGSCGDHQACFGSGDAASCIPCGRAGGSCCEGRTCDGGLGCFDRPDSFTGHRCEACGGPGQQCCPGSVC